MQVYTHTYAGVIGSCWANTVLTLTGRSPKVARDNQQFIQPFNQLSCVQRITLYNKITIMLEDMNTQFLTEVDFALENLCWTLAILHRARTTLGAEYQVCVIIVSPVPDDCDFFEHAWSTIMPGLLMVCFNWVWGLLSMISMMNFLSLYMMFFSCFHDHFWREFIQWIKTCLYMSRKQIYSNKTNNKIKVLYFLWSFTSSMPCMEVYFTPLVWVE